MAEHKRKGDRLEIGDRFRIEPGPARRTAKATTELLDDAKTAARYHLPRTVADAKDPKKSKAVIAKDAMGKDIVEGQDFTYLDDYGKPVFYLYERVEIDLENPDHARFIPQADPTDILPEDSTNVTAYTYFFEPRGTFDTEESAIAEAEKLAKKG